MHRNNNKIKIFIVGAGKAGELIAYYLLKNQESAFEVVGFIDDDMSKQGDKMGSIKVLGTSQDLQDLISRYKVQELFIAIPSERGKTIRKIVENTMGLKVAYKILPRLSEVLLQDFDEDYIKYIRKVKAEDLLGGEILKSDQQEITDYAKNQTILITGAAGSLFGGRRKAR